MSDADDALHEVHDWLAGLTEADEAGSAASEIEFLIEALGLGADDRGLITAPRLPDEAYVAATTAAAAARGAFLAFGAAAEAGAVLQALASFESVLGSGDMDADVALLEREAAVLAAGGRYLIDLVNREWVVQNHVQSRIETGADGSVYLQRSELDFVTSRNRLSTTAIGAGAAREVETSSRRLYTLTELIALLDGAGLGFVAVYGGLEGEAYGPEAPRMVVLARKQA